MPGKYYEPAGYKVVKEGSSYGVHRSNKKANHWVIEPICNKAIIARTCGKIMIAFISNLDMAQGQHMYRLVDYQGRSLYQAPIFDVIFGENIMYLQIEGPSGLQWGYTKDVSGGIKLTPVGPYQIESRRPPAFVSANHLAPGDEDYAIKVTPETPIKPEADGIPKDAYLKTHSGEISIEKKVDPRKVLQDAKYPSSRKSTGTVVEEPKNQGIYTYKVNGRDQLEFTSLEGKYTFTSRSMYKLSEVTDILPAVIGAPGTHTLEQAMRIVHLTQKFESGQGASVISMMILSLSKNGSTPDEKVKQFNAEMAKGWTAKAQSPVEFKAYLLNGGVYILAKPKDSGILVQMISPYYNSETEAHCPDLSLESCKALATIAEGQLSVAKEIKIKNILKADGIVDKNSLPLPGAIAVRPVLVEGIKKHGYNELSAYVLDAEMEVAGTGAVSLEIVVHIGMGFKYTPTSRVGAMSGNGMVETKYNEMFLMESSN
jgi:hypothetical protein